MKLANPVKTTTTIYTVWFLVESCLFYLFRTDTGLFAQIALPFLFGIVHLILSYLLWITVFKEYKNELSSGFKVCIAVLLIAPIVLAFLFLPLFKSIYGQ